MAYAALDSLAKKLDRVLDHQNYRCFKSSDNEALKKKKEKESSDDGERRRCIECVFLRKKLEIQFLHEKVVLLSSFLEDFPREAANLEARLSNAAKQAKSALEFVNLCGVDTADENEPVWKRICQELEESTKEMDSLFQEAMQIKSSSKTHSSTSFIPPRLDTIAKEAIVGFEEVLMEIKGRLCGEPSSHLEIIPIVGMGGIGKTTLARHSYQDPSTAHHFDVRAWVTVLQNSSAEIILSSLLSSIDPSIKKNGRPSMVTEFLVLHGYRYLKNRRYLIVMDDMWDTSLWDEVRMAFPDDCNGSRIIITTRDLDVASYVDSSNKPHNIQLMSVDQSWRLLKEVVFGQENCLPELEKIGKHIAEKCRGLPLAIVVIAGVLSKLQNKQDSWEKIAGNVSEVVNASDQHFSDILSVSYMHLPPHLRPCFLYTACFPEDHEIDVSTLIRLWIAEGFLISNESKDMEELGYEYLEDLARRSLVLIEKKRYDGKIKSVKIHDVLRDLSIRKSRDENFLCIINEFEGSFPQGIENSHCLSICSNVWGCIPNMEFTPIHTILFFSGHWAFDYWKHFRLLKVLDAMAAELRSFAAEISELIHLRYLALGFDIPGKRLRLQVPKSLSKLQNLQTLVMRRSRDNFFGGFVALLPVAIWRMPQLRHIILLNGSVASLPDPSTDDCEEASSLRNLHTLRCIVGFTCSERILEMLPNLIELGICYRDWEVRETGWSKYGLNNLALLHRLQELRIDNYYPNRNSDLAQNIAFPASLKRLTLNGCRIPWEEMTVIGSLPNLEVLKIIRNTYHGTTWETTEGEFCQLKVLQIEITDLHQWMTESSHFPMLERLTLYACDSLQEIPCDIGEISTLKLIEVDVRNLSVVQSAKDIQEEQQSFGNDFQVSILKPRNRW